MGDLVLTGRRRPRISAWRLQTHSNAIAEPALPALPSVGASYRDPTFNTKVMRLTSHSMTVGYSHWASLNRNNTRIVVLSSSSGQPSFYTFDPVNMAILTGPTTPGSLPSGMAWDGCIWSPAVGEESLIYGCRTSANGPVIYTYNVATGTTTTLRDLSAVGTVLVGSAPAATDRLYVMHMSTDTNTFCFNLRNSSDTSLGYIAYDRVNDRILCNVAEATVDETNLAKDGSWMVIQLASGAIDTAGSRVRSFAVPASQTVTDIQVAQTGDADSATHPHPTQHARAHLDTTTAGISGEDGWHNGTGYIAAAAPTALYYHHYLPWATGNGHTSCADNNAAWCTRSTYDVSASPISAASNPFARELYRVSQGVLSGAQTGSVIRFLHHRSRLNSADDWYWASPRANVSYDGQFACYASNWDHTIVDGGAVPSQSVFIAQIPRGL